MKRIIFSLINTIEIIFIFLLLIQCKGSYPITLIDETSIPITKELNKKYYKYNFHDLGAFYEYKENDNTPIPFKPVIYSNIEENPNFTKYPRAFLKMTPHIDDLRYFVEKMNGEYVLYMEKEGKVTMREYAKWYDFDKDKHTQDSIKVLSSRLDTDEKIFNYLKKNNIKYKLISKKTDGYYKSELKILLEANQCYTYITYSPNFIISNMYYNAKDTITLNNNFGRSFFGL